MQCQIFVSHSKTISVYLCIRPCSGISVFATKCLSEIENGVLEPMQNELNNFSQKLDEL